MNGLRMTADEYFALDADGYRYELFDGEVCKSPSPTPRHQNIATRIASQLQAFFDQKPIGFVFHDVGVDLRTLLGRPGIVYRPDVVGVLAEGSDRMPDRIESAPALDVEVLSPFTRQLDQVTKRQDYAAAGVMEYWLADPDAGTMTLLRLRDGQYVEVRPEEDRFTSQAEPGFVLELKPIRRAFK